MQATVETASGIVEGRSAAGVRRFLGVPFAASTGGASRFRPPRRAEPWAGVRSALEPGPCAPQLPQAVLAHLGVDLRAGLPGSSEDCLNLNVWAPTSVAGPRPVLVWIHGGSYVEGAGSLPLYDGARLARSGDVVVVTVNYRLNLFGYLSLDLPDWSANLGVLDQIAALEWVNENISAFGGDPDNVTVFGQSAGAYSLGMLLAAGVTRPRVRRMIGQSGLGHPAADTESAHAMGSHVLRALGLENRQAHRLWDLSVEQLLEGAARATATARADGGMTAGFRPYIDGIVLPRQPLDAVTAGATSGMELLVGTNVDEMHLARPQHLETEQLEHGLERLVGVTASRLVQEYRDAAPSANNADLWSMIWSDHFFRNPALAVAEAHSDRGGSTFMYLFAWPSPLGTLGACHSLEVPFVFGTLGSDGVRAFAPSTPESRRLSTAIVRSWCAFARTGSPTVSSSELPEWPGYATAQRSTMLLDRTPRVVDAPFEARRRAWLQPISGTTPS